MSATEWKGQQETDWSALLTLCVFSLTNVYSNMYMYVHSTRAEAGRLIFFFSRQSDIKDGCVLLGTTIYTFYKAYMSSKWSLLFTLSIHKFLPATILLWREKKSDVSAEEWINMIQMSKKWTEITITKMYNIIMMNVPMSCWGGCSGCSRTRQSRCRLLPSFHRGTLNGGNSAVSQLLECRKGCKQVSLAFGAKEALPHQMQQVALA